MKKYKVGILGATGAVGREMMKILLERDFPIEELHLFASERSAGKVVEFNGGPIQIELACDEAFQGLDIVLGAAENNVARQFAPAIVQAGAVFIDNSSAFRLEDNVPLVVPEVNPEDVKWHKGVIANPNCTTIIMLVAVAPLHRAFGLKRLVASTYQSASGAGAKGMLELLAQTKALLAEAKDMDELAERYRDVLARIDPPKAFGDPIAFNVFPHIDVFQPNGYTKEEMKMVNESRKMLHDPSLRISCTSVRVPSLRAHSESLNLEFSRKVTPEMVREVLATAPGVIVVDDPANNKYPLPIDASGHGEVLAGRIRQDVSNPDGTGIDMFVAGDQLLKGAAYNAVQIAELL